MTSKSIGFSDCCCFNFCLLLFYCQADFGSRFSPLFRGLQSAPNVSHYPVWKSSYSFWFFTSSYIRGNLIFHISFWFVDVIANGRRFTCNRPTAPLIRLTKTNCGQRTNESKIGKFHGNWHYRLSFLVLPLAVNVHRILNGELNTFPLCELCEDNFATEKLKHCKSKFVFFLSPFLKNSLFENEWIIEK